MKILGWVLILVIFSAILFPVLSTGLVGRGDYAAVLAGQPADGRETAYDKIEIVLVGDIMLSRGIGDIIKKRGDPSYPFWLMKDFLKKADLTFGNLENPVSDKGFKTGSIYSFRADPKVINGLKDSGFDVLNLANNHIGDYGRDALNQTMALLKNASLDFIGAGSDYTEAHTPLVKEIRGTKIAFLGYTKLAPVSLTGIKSVPAISAPDRAMAQDIKAAKEKADLVIVSFHWGDEYQTQHNPEQEKMAKLALAAGADLVVGHHPHVVQEVQKYDPGYVAYSLGNFVFDQNFSAETNQGLVLKVTVVDRRIEKVEPLEIGFNNYFQPFLLRK